VEPDLETQIAERTNVTEISLHRSVGFGRHRTEKICALDTRRADRG